MEATWELRKSYLPEFLSKSMKASYVRELADALMDSPILRSTLDEFDITFRHRRMTEAEGAGYSRGNAEEAVLAYFTEHESASTSEVAKASGMSAKTALRIHQGTARRGLAGAHRD
jgi:ATP-dependent DNA helicase RecG